MTPKKKIQSLLSCLTEHERQNHQFSSEANKNFVSSKAKVFEDSLNQFADLVCHYLVMVLPAIFAMHLAPIIIEFSVGATSQA